MKAEQFEATPEFRHFKEVMTGVLSVSKARLDALLKKERKSKQESSRKKKPRQYKKDQPH